MFDLGKFGNFLSHLREGANMTQSELADRLNLPRLTVARYESGESSPDVTVLWKMADLFNTTLDVLISAGEPTKDEAKLLREVAAGEDADPADADTVVGIAPLLKPSVLDRLSARLSAQNIDISHIVALAEYLSADGVKEMIESMDANTIEPELLAKLVPLLDDASIFAIFQKILEGDMPVENLKILAPAFKGDSSGFKRNPYLEDMIEEAVVEGALPWEAIPLLYPEGWEHRLNGDEVVRN